MDCSICLTNITKETGKVELSCSHEYHMKCITRWFAEKEEQTCPCCRKASTEDEIIERKAKVIRSPQQEWDRDDEVAIVAPRLPRHVHIHERSARNIECLECHHHIVFLEDIRGLYGNLLREVERSYCSHLLTVIITTVVLFSLWMLTG